MAENEALALARSMYKDNKKQEARTLLANAIIQSPNDADLWFGLAFCLEDKDQIIYSLNRVLQINPNHPKAAAELQKQQGVLPSAEITENVPPTTELKPQPITAPTPKEPTRPTTPQSASPTAPKQLTRPASTSQRTDDFFLDMVKGEAGGSTAAEAKKWRKIGITLGTIFLLPMAIYAILSLFPSIVKINPILSLVMIVISVTSFKWLNWIIDPIINKMLKYRQGARAEVRVGEILKTLGPNYLIINDIQTGRGNIDHLVLSKTGAVFVIETKSHFGRLEISKDELFHNGYKTEKDFIKQVLGNTFWVKERLTALGITTAWITPILVFTNLWVPESQPIKGVYIENVKFLNRCIAGIARANRNNPVWEKRAEIVRAMGK